MHERDMFAVLHTKDALETKLTAMREALEYEYMNLRTRMPDAAERILHAIEASKK